MAYPRDKREYDIIIVGAGPAGISTVLHLAQIAPELAAKTLILEKALMPREKLCGGGILPDGEVILAGLGLELSEVPHIDVDWARFEYNGRGMKMRVDKDARYAFRTIHRREFDAWLVGKAKARGCRIEEDVQVTGARLENGRVRLDTSRGEYRACVVVGADGSNSLIRRELFPKERAHTARVLEVVTQSKPEASFHIQSDSYFDFFPIPHGIQGYTWDFPGQREGKPVRIRGVYDANTGGRKPRMTLREALNEELCRHGLEPKDYRFEGHPLRWFEPRATFSAPRVLLVGDAAGADALYGEGISLALGYGKIAARALTEAFRDNDFSLRGYRKTILQSKMGKALRWRTWLVKVFYRFQIPVVQRFFWTRLGPVIRWVVRRVVTGWARK